VTIYTRKHEETKGTIKKAHVEPAINPDLTTAIDTPRDLTTQLLTDIGWFSDQDGVPDGVDHCIASDTRQTVMIDGGDTGVTNVVRPDGCTVSDVVSQCAAGAKNHGDYVSCVAQVSDALKSSAFLNVTDHGKIQSCAARAK
jgi:hypothetical protein